MSPPFVLLLLLVGFCAAKDTAVFYGGCLSFATYRDHADNDTLKVHLKLLTGWKTGRGPCGVHCPRNRTRSSTLQSRKSMLLANGEEYFGTWEMEWKDKHDVAHTNDTSPIVAANLTEKVESVNPMAEWELDTADIFIPIPEEIQYVDIIYKGHSWSELTLNKPPTQPPKWHMQVKVNSHSRSDTMHPNRSPVVQMKPFFKLGMNRTYNIHLTAIDEDDDAIYCRFSRYVEAGAAISFHTLPNTVVDKESCSISVDTSDSGVYMENSTGVIAITVIDYPSHLIALDGENDLKTPYKHVLSAVTVQFFVFIVEHADEPIFVDPTPSNRQTFVIYVGVEFTVDYYARPTSPDPARKIVLFDITRTRGKIANYSEITYQERGRKAKITVSLVVTGEDLGKDILCARAEDNEGQESVNMHCFPITIKPYSRTPQRTFKDVPFFVYFPEPGMIVCPVDSYCIFPIYAASTLNGGIANITISSTEALSAVVVGGLRQVNDSETKMIQVKLKEHLGGHRRICFEAADLGSTNTRCLLVNIQRKDPCASIPCLSNGNCIASVDRQNFFCHCRPGYTGRTCEQAPPSPCLTQPCHNGGRCFPVHGSFFCLCSGMYTGTVCDSKTDPCVPDPCNEHSVCVGGDDGSTSCVCTDGYTGPGCNESSSIQPSSCIDGSPDDCADPAALMNVCSDPSTAMFCEKSCGLCECKNNTCSNDSICNAHTRPVTCLCEIGFRGKKCENSRTFQKISFTSPTPEIGSILTCDVQLFRSTKSLCRIDAYLHASGMPSLSVVADKPDLQAKIVNVANTTLAGLRDVYVVEVELDRQTNLDASGYYTVCLNASLKLENTYRCFTVIFKNLLAYPKMRYNQETVFLPPTPEKHTQFMCEQGKECHIIVYTTVNDTAPSKCQQVLVINALGAITFTPRLGKGKCITDVSITNTSSEGMHNLCIKSWAHGESRCYYVDIVRNFKDDCNTNPCSNGGLCTTSINSTLTFSCLCPHGYSGKTCAEGACPVSSVCRNGAYCHTNGTSEICVCRIGYWGTKCEIESGKSSLNGQSIDQATFTDLALPVNVTCYVQTLCYIVFAVTGSSGQSPHLQQGHVSDGIKIETIGVEKHWASGSTYKVVIGLKGDNGGDKRVCVQVTNNSRIQETCVNVIMIENKSIFPVSKTEPYFVQPTLPNNTELKCATHHPCHIPLWTSNVIGNYHCPYVTADNTEEDGLYVFNVTGHSNQCEVDASIFSHQEESYRICFTAWTEELIRTRRKGERRCFQIAFVSSLAASPCSGRVCQNGGFCDSSSNSANCICPIGFSGNNCEISPGNTQSISKTPVLSDLAIPKRFSCKVSQMCDIPFSIRQTTERPEFHLSSREDLAVYGPFIQKDLTFSNTSVGYFRVLPLTPGNHTACLKLQVSDRNEEDTFCVIVESQQDGTNGQRINQNTPHFILPTLPDGSEMVCLPGTTCHCPLYISNGIQDGCSSVTVIGNSTFLHIFPPTTIDAENCIVDVAISSPLNQTERDYMCFDLSTATIPGERRCFTISYEQVSGSQMTLPCEKSCGSGSNGPTQCTCTVLSSADGCSSKEALVRIAFP
ncbi:uncharacterized protein LOC125649402 [Ostrea edulis]|uniref:uncharacterized protein LOC125649402 n=1 Tax=Ostrea edulis TaxID=37623 RepID=UPI0024AEE466|nr:uncharacterized protein LOC125649402 [Ostrea edulis]